MTQELAGQPNRGTSYLSVLLALAIITGMVTLTLAVTHLIALRTATPHFVVLNVALVFYFQQIHKRFGGWVVLVLLGVLATASWALFVFSVQGRDSLEHPVMFLPLAFGVYGLLLATRVLWWRRAPQPAAEPVQHPARTRLAEVS